MKIKRGIFFAVIAVVLLCLSVTVFAASGQKSIVATYNNIKLMIDGKLFTPKDQKNNVVEPFTYNGTTYVPIRAVSEAFGKDVGWDAKTATVTIGDKSVTYLDTMGVYDYSTKIGKSYNESKGEFTIQDKKFERGVCFYQYAGNNEKTGETEVTETSYLLNGEYKNFYATLIAGENNESGMLPSTMKIYGDGKVLYTSPQFDKGTKPMDIAINTGTINTLIIEISSIVDYSIYGNKREVYLGDARLTK